jgi:hypothetical protein
MAAARAGCDLIVKEKRGVIGATQTSPMVIELVRRMQDTQVFLRMAAIELRRIAEEAPEIADELRHIAQKVEAEAGDLARRDTE